MKKAIVRNIVVVIIAILLPTTIFAQKIDTKTALELIKTHSENRYATWIELINKISKNKKVKIAEIGVWKGAFAAQILKNCPNVEKYYLVDPWRHLTDWKKPMNLNDDKFNKIYKETMKTLDFAKDKICVLRGTTLEVVDQINDSELDLVYIDGDHTAKGVVIDLIKLFPKVKEGGVIGGDDYEENIYHHDPNRFDPTMVKPVVDGFVAAHNVKHLFWNKNQFAFIKRGSGNTARPKSALNGSTARKTPDHSAVFSSAWSQTSK